MVGYTPWFTTGSLSLTHCVIAEPSDVSLIASVEEDGFASPSPVLHTDQVALLKGGALPSIEVVHLQRWSTDSCLQIVFKCQLRRASAHTIERQLYSELFTL